MFSCSCLCDSVCLLFFRFLFACRSSGATSASVYYYYYYYYFFDDYSMYVIKICFVSYFLVSQSYLDAKIKIRRLFLGLNKVLKRKKGTRLGADISLPYCLATGIGNLVLIGVTGAEITRSFVRYDALLMKSFCLLIRLSFAKAFSKMKLLKMTEYKIDLHGT